MSIIPEPSLSDPLFHPGWLAFNEESFGLRAEHKTFGPERGTSWELETVLYRDKKGRLIFPQRNPYLPVAFQSASDQVVKVNRRKRMAVQQLADYCSENPVVEKLTFSAILDDPRPFGWNGFIVEPRFTWQLELKNYEDALDSGIRQKVRKAEKLGYRCEHTTDWRAVIECLEAPEDRKGFSYRLTSSDLMRLHDLASEVSAAFLCVDDKGNPVAGRITLYTPGGMAMGWVIGVKSNVLANGVNALLHKFSLCWFVEQNCTHFDFAGANIPAVAEMKEAWGGQLVPFYAVHRGGVRTMLRDAYYRFQRRRT